MKSNSLSKLSLKGLQHFNLWHRHRFECQNLESAGAQKSRERENLTPGAILSQ